MVSISLAVITYNEEKNIRHCLESAHGIADEILVVDSFSNDKTVEICRSLGARVLERKFTNHIDQKNFALKKCSHDYVLSLDGDECLSEELRGSILQVKSNWQGDGYCFNRRNNYAGKWIRYCGWYPDRKLRLVYRPSAQWGGINPHDILQLKNKEKGKFLKGDILHYTYDSISDHVRQTNYFTDINAQHSFDKGIRSNIFKIVTRPIFKFIRDYFLKLGFLDGRYGFIICSINAMGAMLKYAKIMDLQKARTRLK